MLQKVKFFRRDERTRKKVFYNALLDDGRLVELYNSTTGADIPLNTRIARKLADGHPSFKKVLAKQQKKSRKPSQDMSFGNFVHKLQEGTAVAVKRGRRRKPRT